MKLFTIGFTKSSAESFFNRLQRAGIKTIIDVRLNNSSQLSGFAKKEDLRYFLRSICGIVYYHQPQWAPTQEMLDSFKKEQGSWEEYESNFLELMSSREAEQCLQPEILDQACLLCSEEHPRHCHRRLVAEYLQAKWPEIEIVHL